jgi:hypothetical protein
MIENFEKHPLASGLLSAGSSVGLSIVSILSNEQTVRLLGSIGALLGISLTCLSIFVTIKKMIKEWRQD